MFRKSKYILFKKKKKKNDFLKTLILKYFQLNICEVGRFSEQTSTIIEYNEPAPIILK